MTGLEPNFVHPSIRPHLHASPLRSPCSSRSHTRSPVTYSSATAEPSPGVSTRVRSVGRALG